MAYSQGVARKNGTTFYAINLWSSRSDVSINTSRISWSADVTFGDWYYWGVRLHIAVDGVEVGSWAGACTHSGQKVINVSGTRDVGRGASSRNIQVSAWTTSETVSGYGGVGITTSCATTETIPQKGYLTPRPPKSFAASRVSDTEMGMTWQADYTGMDGDYPWSNVLIDRRTDDGEWVQIATLGWNALNYTDRTTSAGHKYEYGARATGPGGTSTRVTATALFTTPNAPTSATLSKLSGTSVRVGIDGAPKYVDKYNMQSSVNDGAWGASQDVASFPTTITASGKVKVRVQAVKGSLVSAWRESDVVTTIVAPNAPTLTTKPASVVATGSTLKLCWTRNHPDGSAQTSAQVGYTVDSQQEVVADISGGTSTYTLPASIASKACAVKVRVRTKGLAEDWGAWSSQYAFKVAVPPSAVFTVPGVDGAKIGDLPLVVHWDVNDVTGVASQRIELLDAGGSVLHSATPGNSTRKYTFGDGTYRLANATAYRLRLTVRGGSSLSVTTERRFSTSFAEPARPTALVELDRDSLSQAVTVQEGSRYSDEAGIVTVEATKGTLVPGLSVFGQTRQNLWQNPSGTSNGVTVNSGDDGSLSISGTASSNTYIFTRTCALVPGRTYVFTANKAISNNINDACLYAELRNSQGVNTADTIYFGYGTNLKQFIKIPGSNTYTFCGIKVMSGMAASVSGIRVMLREATEDEIAAAQSTPSTLQEGGTADLPQDRPVTLPAYPDELAEAGAFDWVKPGINGAEPKFIDLCGRNLWRDFEGGGVYRIEGGGIRVTAGTTWGSLSNQYVNWSAGTVFEFSCEGLDGITQPTGPGLFLFKSDGTKARFKAEDSDQESSELALYYGAKYKRAILLDDAMEATFFFNGYGITDELRLFPYLRVDSNNDSYEPPSYTSTPLDLKGHQLHMLHDGTRDELRIDGTGAVTLIQRVGSVTFDGETFKVAAALNNGNQLTTNVSDAVTLNVSHGPSTVMICDKMRTGSANGIWGGQHTACGISREGVVIFHIEGVSTVEGANDWLKSMTPKVLYKLAKEKEVPLGSIAMPEFPAESSHIWAASDIPCTVRVNYPTVDSISVTRVLADGSRWLVADGLIGGQQCIDPLPPLNTDYNYELTAATEAGAAATTRLGQRIDSKGRMALNFGAAASVAHVMGANAKVSASVEHAGELYHFADGGESGGLPVWYGTGDMDASGSVSFELHDRAERDRFQRSARIYTVGWFRDVMGGRKRARMSYDESVSASGRATWEESVDMDEIVFEEAW